MSNPTPITLSQLQAKIVAESQNQSSELANELNEIIRDSERFVNRELELDINWVYGYGNFYSSGDVVNGVTLLTGMNAYLYLPLDCVSVQDITVYQPIGSNPPATDGSDQWLAIAYPLNRIAQGLMDYYAPDKTIIGFPINYFVGGSVPVYGTGNPSPLTGVIGVGPTPDQNYAYRIQYVTQQESLVDLGPGQYNYLSTWYPDCLFYACMVRYGEFSKKTEQIQFWTAQLTEALKMGKEEEIRRKGQSYKDLSETTEPLTVRNK